MVHLLFQALRPWGPMVVVAALLAGCAQGPLLSPPSPAPLLHDTLFGHPARPTDADTVLAIDEPMRAHLRKALPKSMPATQRPWALAESLQPGGGLALRYDASRTRTASEAFAAQAGNCLSLVLMTAALAREAGLEVRFQQALGSPLVTREEDLVLLSGHVNVVLDAPRPRREWNVTQVQPDPRGLQIDFLPEDDLRGLRLVAISEPRVRAMFMSNRAAEALLAQQPAQAYAWAREAVLTDPTYWPALNTLGVVYQRAGHLDEARAAYAHALAQDAQNQAALGNLDQMLRRAVATSTSPAEQARYTAKLDALRALAVN